jgi:hypothetical protein
MRAVARKTARLDSRERLLRERSLLDALRSNAPLSEHQRRILINLIRRHGIAAPAASRPPSALDSKINAQVLAEFADEFRRQPKWRYGPITKAEMDEAAKVMEKREKAAGRAGIKFDGKTAAKTLREECLVAFADYYGLTVKELEAAVLGKHGSINRAKKKANPA